MSYIHKTLLSNEKLIHQTHKHWIIFTLPLLFTLIGFALIRQNDILVLPGYLSLFIALYYWLTAITMYVTSEFAVTNRRVLIKTGFINRQTWETLLPKVATLEVKQSILGRMSGYGTLVIQSTGGSKDAFSLINHPLLFRRKVQEQAEAMPDFSVPSVALQDSPDASRPETPIIPEPRERP